MVRILAALSVSAVLAGLLAGCGDDDDVGSASTPAPKSDAPAAEGTGYTITWSAPADEFQAEEATLDAMLASWRWTGSAATGERRGS
jgi:hypothetical protein